MNIPTLGRDDFISESMRRVRAGLVPALHTACHHGLADGSNTRSLIRQGTRQAAQT